jgi:four helix bundle protein
MAPSDNAQDIRDRTFRFACNVTRFALGLPPRIGVRAIGEQLLRSATSVGANLEEAKAASSTREFVRCIDIALKESREAVYWLRICRDVHFGAPAEVEELRGEAEQISRILGAIAIRTKRRMWAERAVFAFCILNFEVLLFS